MNHTLNPNHKQDLESSGLTPETVEAAGIYSETSHCRLAEILNRKSYSRKNGSALVFPYRDGSGDVVLCRVKPDRSPTISGKPAKYLSPVGAELRAYFPPGVHEKLADTGQAVFISEGEKKALAGAQAGLVCVGLSGIDCWHRKKSSALLDDLARIAWKGRKTYIVFDSDAADNENVRTNESLLAAVLANHGATVRIVRLPHGPDGEKVGLDDFLLAQGIDEFWKLVDTATEPEPVEPDELKVSAAALDPAREAKRILDTMIVDGVSRLRHWRGTFWHWRDGAYREESAGEVKSRVVSQLNHQATSVGGRVVADTMMQLAAQSLLPGCVESPAWLDGDAPWPADEVLVARNGLFHLPSIVDGKTAHHLPPTPRYFATAALDYNVSLNAPKPNTWFAFLDSVWPGDPGAADLLQEWFGYILTPDTRQHKILFLIGPKRSGKGTIARVARGLIGPKNVCGPTLAGLAGQFGLWPLIGKSLAIVSDARLSGRSDKAMVVERLLSVSGEDAIDVDRKCIEPLRSVNLPTRFCLLSNETPRLTDASGALASRMLFIQMTRSWYGKEDTSLTGRLIDELPGILLWALGGWKRLRDRGRFNPPESGRKLAQEMEELGSPVAAFVRDECLVSPCEEISRADLYETFVEWSKSHGRIRIPDVAGFGRDLRAAVPGISDTHHRMFGKLVRFYRGVILAPCGAGD